MKKNYSLLAASALLALAVGCNSGQTAVKTETRTYEDSTKYASLKIEVELPVVAKGAAGEIRKGVISCLDDQLTRITTYENEKMFPSFDGNADDTDALFGYYTSQAFSVLSKTSQEDAEERERYVNEDEEMSEEQKADILANFPAWEYDYSFKKIDESDRYVVFYSQNYIYQGGAHGGITGAGGLTFDKKDGHLVETFFDSSSTSQMQPVLIKGLIQYYKDMDIEMSQEDLLSTLHIENGIIPLPVWQPYPTKDGLLFTYQQYEIASYAEGMPSFVLPFAEVAPYLTPDAKAVLGL